MSLLIAQCLLWHILLNTQVRAPNGGGLEVGYVKTESLKSINDRETPLSLFRQGAGSNQA